MSGVRFGKPYAQCVYCGKWVRMSGLLAGIHLCVDEETIRRNEALRVQIQAQRKAKPTDLKHEREKAERNLAVAVGALALIAQEALDLIRAET